MRLIFIGTGSAFTVGDGNYQSNIILEADSKEKLLIDCGSDARLSLYEQGFSYQDIQDVYISHLHADHIGGLEWLAFTNKFNPIGAKPCLHLSDQLVKDLWDKALSASLNPSQDPTITLSTYFDVDVISNKIFHWKKTSFHLFETLHIVYPFWRMPSYGLWFETNKKNILITTDTQLFEGMQDLYHQSHIIFQDCETDPIKSGVHAHYTELKNLDLSIKNKMWLYHYQPGSLPNAKEDGFRGFISKGQCFDFNNEETLFQNER